MTDKFVISSQETQRYIVVTIPDWAVVSLDISIPPGACAVTADRGRVVEATFAARRMGIRSGMRISSAQLLVPHVMIFPADLQAEAQRFEAVMQSLETVVAHVNMAQPGIAWCRARGPVRWYGSEEKVAETLIDAVSRDLGIESTIGIANGILTALVAAQSSRIVAPGKEKDYLSALPLSAAVEFFPFAHQRYGQLVSELELLGISTCGQISSCEESAFYARFGYKFRELAALSSGRDVFTPQIQRGLEELVARYECEEEENSIERLMIPMARLAQESMNKMLIQGVSAGAMTTRFITDSGQEYERRWGHIDAQRSEEITQRMVWHMNSVLSSTSLSQEHKPDSGVRSLEIRLLDLREALTDSVLWGKEQEDADRVRSLDHIATLLGENSVFSLHACGAFDPRHSIRYSSWGMPLEDFPGVLGMWEGKVSDPPEIVCHRPIRILLQETDEKEESFRGRGAQVIPFPRLFNEDAHPAPVNTSLDRREITVDPAGTVSSYAGHINVLREGKTDLVLPWKFDQPIPCILKDPVWTVRGRWWEGIGEPSDKRTVSARHYIRAQCQDGTELLLLYEDSRWWIEGIYDRKIT